jgi:hypothetical protein
VVKVFFNVICISFYLSIFFDGNLFSLDITYFYVIGCIFYIYSFNFLAPPYYIYTGRRESCSTAERGETSPR